jgi:SOS-response transcriptional repressor LexA
VADRAATRGAFATWLKDRLAEQNVTRAQLAREIGADPSAVSNWTNAKDLPAPHQLRPMAHALDVDPLWLLGLAGYVDAVPGPPARPQRSVPDLLREVQRAFDAATSWPVLGTAAASTRDGVDAETGEPARRFALMIQGDCLMPEIAPGELVTFDRERAARVGDIVAAVVNGERHVKRLMQRNGGLTLGDNYGNVIVPVDDAQIIGVKEDIWQPKDG